MLRAAKLCLPIFAVAAIAAGAGLAQTKAARPARPAAVEKARICEPVSAIAVGFGVENATVFAQGNLDNAIDRAKDQLASQGAKGFAIEGRSVKCEDYIDFGGSVGREHKCRASATLCGKLAGAPPA